MHRFRVHLNPITKWGVVPQGKSTQGDNKARTGQHPAVVSRGGNGAGEGAGGPRVSEGAVGAQPSCTYVCASQAHETRNDGEKLSPQSAQNPRVMRAGKAL